MISARSLADGLGRFLGLRIRRFGAAARFQAQDVCLMNMKRRGYHPKVIVDAGANVGQFHALVRPLFPSARYHLIEPQPACQPDLRRLASRWPESMEVHAVAVTEPGVCSVRMVGCGSTGAYVANPQEHLSVELEVAATTLDALLDERIRAEDRVLLKLDLESHEMAALRGATSLLRKVEAVLLEVSFYDTADRGRPLFAEVVAFFDRAGFPLYDFASLASRPRDGRLRLGDVVFVRRESPLLSDTAWE